MYVLQALRHYTTVSSNTTKQRQRLSRTLPYVQCHKKMVCQITLHKIKSIFSCVTELVNIIMLQHERKHRF